MDNFNLDRRIELINRALEIIENRSNDETRPRIARLAYNSAATIIRYALEENEECLNQFDY